MAEFNAQKVTIVAKDAAFDPEASLSVKGTDGGTFAIASNKKELKQLMKSDVDVVYDEKKGKLFFNDNGTKKGWGKKKVGGLVAKLKGKPELSADHFDGLSAHKSNAINGSDYIKDKITSLGEELGDEKMSELYGETLINPKKGLKRIVKAGKKEGYLFKNSELVTALDEMNRAGSFSNLELDDAALASLMGMGGALQHNDGELAKWKLVEIF